jgi:hypothetical protein
MESNYQEAQRAKAVKLIEENPNIFYGEKAGKVFRDKEREFVLNDGGKNLFGPIQKSAVKYFKQNSISWWGGSQPTGHVLSSQIACLNHLFSIREDKDAVLTLIRNVSSEFEAVLPITSDKFSPAYIQFEAVSDKDHLREKSSTRGNNCTSIDALIYAVAKDGSKWIIPIEWKFTEFYDNQDKSIEGMRINPEKNRGKERQERYNDLITASTQLVNDNLNDYYFEPFYQLMRQTLWAEQLIKNSADETVKADHYLHIHVVPTGNRALLKKKYKCSGSNMEITWRKNLSDQSKYQLVTPEKLLTGIDPLKYAELLDYLKVRYWND